jgi:hypothetical protein
VGKFFEPIFNFANINRNELQIKRNQLFLYRPSIGALYGKLKILEKNEKKAPLHTIDEIRGYHSGTFKKIPGIQMPVLDFPFRQFKQIYI